MDFMTYCVSNKKCDELNCDKCIRNLPQYEVTTDTEWEEFKLMKKFVKGKIITVCKGYERC